MFTNWKAARQARRLCVEANHYRSLLNLVYHQRDGDAQPLADIGVTFVGHGPFHIAPKIIKLEGVAEAQIQFPLGEYHASRARNLTAALEHLPFYRRIGAELERHREVQRLTSLARERTALEHPPKRIAKQHCTEANYYLKLLILVRNEIGHTGQPLADIGVHMSPASFGRLRVLVEGDGARAELITPPLVNSYSPSSPSEVRAATLALPACRMLGDLAEHPAVIRALDREKLRKEAEQAAAAARMQQRRSAKKQRQQEEQRIKRKAIEFDAP